MGGEGPPSGGGLTALLRESAEDLYENAPCGYLSALPDGTLVRVNRTLLAWTGRSAPELLGGLRFPQLLTVGGRLFWETHLRPLLRMQGFVNEVQLDLLRGGDRPPLPVLANLALKVDAHGHPLFLRVTVFDISDRRRFERELQLARKKAEAATRVKADFLSMVSHEIRTPMNAIIGATSLLHKTGLSPQQQRYLRILDSSSGHLLGLLDSILDFSKIEAGKVTLEEQPLDLRQLVYQTLFVLSARAEEKQLAVEVQLDPRLPEQVVGDVVKLGQVLTNLVSNAIKFTERGSITVSVQVLALSDEDVTLEVAVADTGIGIAEEQRAHIFEEFTQASADIGVRFGGTGLGLAISQRLVDLYGSRIHVESTPGEGSRFSFELRLRRVQPAAAAALPAPPEAVPPEALRLQGLRVLVAEDNVINAFVLEQFLGRWGVAFDVVHNGREALERVRETAYALVLLDLRMPELNGYQTARAIRALPGEAFQRLPIIAVTASARLGLEERLDDAGITDHLGKPFKPEDLLAKLLLHAAAPQGLAAEPPPAAPAPVGSCDLEALRELAEDDPRALAELSRLAVGRCLKHKRGLRLALKGGNREEFAYHSRRLELALLLLGARRLRAALQAAETLLAGGPMDAAQVEDTLAAIDREVDALVEGLRAPRPLGTDAA